MTTMIRSPTMRSQQLAGLLPLVGAHAGDRLVEEHHLGVLHEQHADLEPLLLPVGEDAGRPIGQRREADGLQRLLDLRRHAAPGPEPADLRLRCSPAAMSRFCTTLSCSNTVAVWNVRPIPRRTIWWDCSAEQVLALVRRAARALHQPGQGVDQGGLAGAVRADEEVQPALVQVEVDALDRLEAVEVDGEVADLEVVLTGESTVMLHLEATCRPATRTRPLASFGPATRCRRAGGG